MMFETVGVGQEVVRRSTAEPSRDHHKYSSLHRRLGVQPLVGCHVCFDESLTTSTRWEFPSHHFLGRFVTACNM